MSPLCPGATRRADQSAVVPAHSKSDKSADCKDMNWPHAPRHWLFEPGIYMAASDLECGDVSPLSPGATRRADQSAVVPAQSKSNELADSKI